MIISIDLYNFIPVSRLLTHFQGHKRAWKSNEGYIYSHNRMSAWSSCLLLKWAFVCWDFVGGTFAIVRWAFVLSAFVQWAFVLSMSQWKGSVGNASSLPILITVLKFHGHSNTRKLKLKTMFSGQILIQPSPYAHHVWLLHLYRIHLYGDMIVSIML